MEQVKITKSYLDNIGNSLRNKYNNTIKYKPDEMASAIDSIPTGGGDIINGIIEQYKASTETISANTFVEFVANMELGTSLGAITNTTDGIGKDINCVALTENQLFVSFLENSTSTSGIKLYGLIATIQDGSLSLSPYTVLNTGVYRYTNYLLIRLDSKRVAIFYHLVGSGTSQPTLVCTCKIEDNIISTFKNSNLSTSSYNGGNIRISKLRDDDYIILIKNDSKYFVFKEILFNELNITIEKSSTTSESSSPLDYSLIKFNENTLVFCYRLSSSSTSWFYKLITIDSTNIRASTRYSSSAYINSGFRRGLQLENNRAMISMGASIAIFELNDTNISTNSQKSFGLHVSGTLDYLEKIDESLFLETHSSPIYINLCKLDGNDTFRIMSTLDLNAFNSYSLAIRNKTKAFLILQQTSINPFYLYELDITKFIKESSFSSVDGLTKTECTTSTAGDVWVLNN